MQIVGEEGERLFSWFRGVRNFLPLSDVGSVSALSCTVGYRQLQLAESYVKGAQVPGCQFLETCLPRPLT